MQDLMFTASKWPVFKKVFKDKTGHLRRCSHKILHENKTK
jgi:hypothetical protein